MNARIDYTHDAAKKSWVESAWGHPDFPLQNLPLGTFRTDDGQTRMGVAIGDEVLDLRAAHNGGLLDGKPEAVVAAATASDLREFLTLDSDARGIFRRMVFDLLVAEAMPSREVAEARRSLVLPKSACAMELPTQIGDYTDFYAGFNHALAVGKLFRPENPLLPNYAHLPIGYHGRSSSIVPSGASIRRPSGQTKAVHEPSPSFAPTRKLDYELELGLIIGPGNELGQSIGIGEAGRHIAGFCLLNDLSARDIQAWEYQPLGPFLSKSFATVISPWIVMSEALAPFSRPQPSRQSGHPVPPQYLIDPTDQQTGAFDIDLEASLSTTSMRAEGLQALRICSTSSLELYWTYAQMIAHHTSGGCNLRPGDLIGSGTISSIGPGGSGSLLEATMNGTQPLRLSTGEARAFLEDGDEILITGRCRREGFTTIGFGACRATVGAYG